MRVIDTEGARELLAAGVTFVDVLPQETYRQEHLPGACNIPLAEIDSAADRLDPSAPVVVYCFDHQ